MLGEHSHTLVVEDVEGAQHPHTYFRFKRQCCQRQHDKREKRGDQNVTEVEVNESFSELHFELFHRIGQPFFGKIGLTLGRYQFLCNQQGCIR